MNRYGIFAAAALLMLFSAFSCTGEFSPPEEFYALPDGITVISGITLPEGCDSKTSLGEISPSGTHPTLWSEGDRVSLNGRLSSALDASMAGDVTAQFSIHGSFQAPFNILYPGTEEKDIIEIPSIQCYKAGTFDPKAMPMFYSGDTYLAVMLNHLCSVLHFKFTSETPVALDSLVVTSLGNEPLSGTFRMETDVNGYLTGNLSALCPRSSVCLDAGDVTLGSTPTDFYICVPAGAYSDGFQLRVSDRSGSSMVLYFKRSGTDHELKAAQMLNFPSQAYKGHSVFIISDVATLLEYASNADKYPEAEMTADINLSGVPWTPIPEISGSFDGKGHSITNINASPSAGASCFVSVLNGALRNLTFGAADDSESSSFFLDEPATGVFAAPVATVGKLGRIENVVNYASIGGTSTVMTTLSGIAANCSGRVTNCVNYGVINTPSSACAVTYLGGIVASASDSAIISASSNYGALSIAGILGAAIDVGGIVGVCDGGTVEVSECTNTGTGTISVLRYDDVNNLGADLRIGGVVGYVNSRASIRQCRNEAYIHNDAYTLTSHQFYAGGILGFINANYCEIIDCSNTGSIYNFASASTIFFGGMLGYANTSSTPVIEHCTNSGTLTNGEYGNTRAYAALSSERTDGPVIAIGGILGYAMATKDSFIRHCENLSDGAVTNNGGVGTNKNQVCIGGIAGSYRGGKLDWCVNRAPIAENGLLRSSKYIRSYAGGILGSTFVSKLQSLSHCDNYGTVSTSADNKFVVALGGIVGADASATEITNCVNYKSATITRNNGSSQENMSGGIVGYILNEDFEKPEDAYTSGNVQYCYNYADINSLGKVSATVKDKTGGVLGWAAKVTYFYNCGNYGKVECDSGSLNPRIGGFAPTMQTVGCYFFSCFNEGDVVLKKATGATSITACPQIGGFLAYQGQVGGFYNCSVKCKVINEVTGLSYENVGGFLAQAGSGSPVVDCSVQVDLTSSLGNDAAGLFAGYSKGSYAPSACVVKDGSVVNGVTMTADNYADYLQGTQSTTVPFKSSNTKFN